MRFHTACLSLLVFGNLLACSQRSESAFGLDAAASDAFPSADSSNDAGRDMNVHALIDLGPPSPDLCDDIDNDFDPSTADGSADARYHESCVPDPSAPASACEGWVQSCEGGSWHCKQLYGPESDPIAIVAGEGRTSGASIAWNGTNYVVAYAAMPEGARTWSIRVKLISEMGEVVEGPLEVGTGLSTTPKLATNGDETIVVWANNGHNVSAIQPDVAYARVSSTLSLVTSGTIDGGFAGVYTVAVAHNSHGYIVSWAGQALGSSGAATTFHAHLGNDGGRTAAVYTVGTLPGSSRGISEFVTVSADEFGYVAGWSDGESNASYVQAFDNAFVPVGEPIEFSGAASEGIALVAQESRVGASWYQTNQISFAALDRDGAMTVDPWAASSAGGAFLFDPQMISACASFALTWQQVFIGSTGGIASDGIYIVQLATDARSIEWETNLSCITEEPTDWTARQSMARGNGDEIGVVWIGGADQLLFVNVRAPCNLLF